jgi:hypothetical protein
MVRSPSIRPLRGAALREAERARAALVIDRL